MCVIAGRSGLTGRSVRPEKATVIGRGLAMSGSTPGILLQRADLEALVWPVVIAVYIEYR